MHVLIVGVNHRTAPVEVREKLAFASTQIADGVRDLLQGVGARECVILSTCNRAEFYLAVEEPAGAAAATLEFLGKYRGFDSAVLLKHAYWHQDAEAAGHLFRVASGIDSMVTGESQILGQVRDAYREALDAGTAQRLLAELFQRALNVGKRARTETRIGEGTVSVGSAAVELALSIFGDLNGKRVLILGAGKINTITARHLLSQGVEAAFVANRTFERAVELARELNGSAIPYEKIAAHLPQVDIVISSTAAPHYVVDVPLLKGALKARHFRPMFLIDLAVPRDIDPAVGRLPDVYLYNIDALSEIVEYNRAGRGQEVRQVEAIVAEEAQGFAAWLRSLAVRPTVQELTTKYERLSTDEAEAVLNKLPSLTEREQELVRAMAKRVRTKILHDVLTYLRQIGESGTAARELATIRRLFNLENEEEERQP